MDILKRVATPIWMSLSGLVACSPIDISVFSGSETDESPPPTTIIDGAGGNGGESPIGQGGAAVDEVLLIDTFDDGDSKGEDPAGWWYKVNDGTGTQELSVVPAETGPPGGTAGGFVLRVEGEGFSLWGSAFGIDVLDFDLGAGAATLSFRIAADAPVELELHALDGTGAHFTRIVPVTTSWALVEIHLDQMFLVGGDSVRRFDVATADELQWFRFDGVRNVIWLDDVTLQTSSGADVR